MTHHLLYTLPPVQQWLTEVSHEWVRSFQSDPDFYPAASLFRTKSEGRSVGDSYPESDVIVAVARVLRSAVSFGHGGAFAVLPDVNTAPLKIKYPVDLVDLGAELFETWRAHCKVWNLGRDVNADHVGAAESKRVAANRWLSRLSSVGQLSVADGCVVLDRRLVLHGFGGSIDTDLTGLELGVCHDLSTNGEVPAAELLRSFGERHKSAFALCRRVPNAIVFVISQDGDLRVFASGPEGQVYFATDLTF